MSDDQELRQDDIEALFAQAGGGGSEEPSGGDQPQRPQQEAPPAAQSPPPSQPAKQPATSAGDDLGLAQGDIELLLQHAQDALNSVEQGGEPAPAETQPFSLREFSGAPASTDEATLDLLRDVELDLKIELGRTHMYLEDVLRLRKGSVVPLDKLAGDPVDVYVNGRLIARGEVLVLNDNFCVRVAELIAAEPTNVA